jgi:hypothetical protein
MPEDRGGEIAKADWPIELVRLQPKEVRVAPERVYVRFGSFFVAEWGLFILPKGSPFQPPRGGDPSYVSLGGRVYRYDIKG